MLDDLRIAQGLFVPGSDLSWTASRSAGPGGQNVNKVSTKVTLRFDLPGNRTLPPQIKARLRRIAGLRRLDASGALLITEQRTRSQSQNLAIALDKLTDLLLEAAEPPKPRRKTRPTLASKRRRLNDKRRQKDKKRQRGRVSRDD